MPGIDQQERFAFTLFDQPQPLWRAIRALMDAGFNAQQLCVVESPDRGESGQVAGTGSSEARTGLEEVQVKTFDSLSRVVPDRASTERKGGCGAPVKSLKSVLDAPELEAQINDGARALIVRSRTAKEQAAGTRLLLKMSSRRVQTYEFKAQSENNAESMETPMSYRKILLHLHDIARADRLLSAGVGIARRMDAHLVGLSILPPAIVIPGPDGMGTGVVLEDHRLTYKDEMHRLKEAFETATRDGMVQGEWREYDALYGDPAAEIIEQGRCADLIIASQRNPKWGFSELIEHPDRLPLESGRPVLFVPNEGEIRPIGKRVLVAWNARREAARAVFDSIPLLKRADDVQVLWINPERDAEHARDLPTAEICATLAHHNVKCTGIQASAAGNDIGGELMRQAKAYNADLVVMGAYGHSRLREFLLGGASAHLLSNMTIPVLMSH